MKYIFSVKGQFIVPYRLPVKRDRQYRAIHEIPSFDIKSLTRTEFYSLRHAEIGVNYGIQREAAREYIRLGQTMKNDKAYLSKLYHILIYKLPTKSNDHLPYQQESLMPFNLMIAF